MRLAARNTFLSPILSCVCFNCGICLRISTRDRSADSACIRDARGRYDRGDWDGRYSKDQGTVSTWLAGGIPIPARGPLPGNSCLAFLLGSRLAQRRSVGSVANAVVIAAARPRHGEQAVVAPYPARRLFEERLVIRPQIDFQTPRTAILLNEIPIGVGNRFRLQ